MYSWLVAASVARARSRQARRKHFDKHWRRSSIESAKCDCRCSCAKHNNDCINDGVIVVAVIVIIVIVIVVIVVCCECVIDASRSIGAPARAIGACQGLQHVAWRWWWRQWWQSTTTAGALECDLDDCQVARHARSRTGIGGESVFIYIYKTIFH